MRKLNRYFIAQAQILTDVTMNNNDILPPGKHYLDPRRDSVDPVSFSLQKLQELLIWLDEHRSSFERNRNNNPLEAENELSCLKDATYQAILRLQRLSELIFAGYGVDSSKEIPRDICNTVWIRAVGAIQNLLQIDSKAVYTKD